MHTDQFDFLRALVEATGPSGYEWDAQRIWRERVADVAATTWTDSLGNAFATLNPGGSPRVMIEAHIDQIGFIVTYFDEQGFVYFKPIGHFDPSTVVGTRVRLMGRHGPVEGAIGRMPVHLLEAEAQSQAPELKNLWIDVGASSRAEVEERLSVGDAGAWSAGMTRLLGSCIAAPGLDNRAGAYVIAEAFRALAAAHPHAEVIAASSVQEEIGLRGAQVSAYTADARSGSAPRCTGLPTIRMRRSPSWVRYGSVAGRSSRGAPTPTIASSSAWPPPHRRSVLPIKCEPNRREPPTTRTSCR